MKKYLYLIRSVNQVIIAEL